MREDFETNRLQERAVVTVEQEGDGGDRQEPADRAAGRLEHQQRGHRAEQDVEPARGRGAVDELVEVDDWPGQDQHRDGGQRPVDRRHPGAPGGDGRVEHENEDQRDQQEADPIDLRLDDAHHPVECVERQPGGQHPDQPVGKAGQLSCRGFGVRVVAEIDRRYKSGRQGELRLSLATGSGWLASEPTESRSAKPSRLRQGFGGQAGFACLLSPVFCLLSKASHDPVQACCSR